MGIKCIRVLGSESKKEARDGAETRAAGSCASMWGRLVFFRRRGYRLTSDLPDNFDLCVACPIEAYLNTPTLIAVLITLVEPEDRELILQAGLPCRHAPHCIRLCRDFRSPTPPAPKPSHCTKTGSWIRMEKYTSPHHLIHKGPFPKQCVLIFHRLF